MKSQIKILQFLFASFVCFAGHSLFGQGLISDLTVQRTVILAGVITPTQLAANTDDWAPTNFSKALTVRVSTDASRNLTGIAGGALGRTITLENVGSFPLVLKNDVTSTAANRFALASDYTLAAGTGVLLKYDATSSRWRIVGSQTAPSTNSGTVTHTGGALTSNSVVLGAGTDDVKVVAGVITDGTSKLILGVAGSSVGSIDFKNATSGTINVAPPTGALGTVALVLPGTSGTIATKDDADTAANVSTQNSQASNYTLVLGDRLKTIIMTSASANALTVPPNSSVAFPLGTRIPGWTTGAGATTLTAGAGVTLNSRASALTSAGQYAAWMLEKTATDTWLATGDLVP